MCVLSYNYLTTHFKSPAVKTYYESVTHQSRNADTWVHLKTSKNKKIDQENEALFM